MPAFLLVMIIIGGIVENLETFAIYSTNFLA